MPKYNSNPTNLEKARRAAGLTRKELAQKSGMSFSTLKSCEQRRRNINTAPAIDVISVADILGVPVKSILNPCTEDDD